MRTQSRDTHPDAERMLISLLRAASSQKRFRLVQALTQSGIWATIYAWCAERPLTSEREAAVQYASCAYGAHMAEYIQRALDQREGWQVQPGDLIEILLPAWQVLENLQVAPYIGGSVASSVHGMQQLAQDTDLVIDVPDVAPSVLMDQLRPHYVFDEPMVEMAIQQGQTFSLIHLDTLKKVDVIIPHAGMFDRAMRSLVALHTLDERYPPFRVASAPEMILWKLRRYHQYQLVSRNGMEDDATWNDVLGMLKVEGPELDLALLEQWAEVFGISDILRLAFDDAGILTIPQ